MVSPTHFETYNASLPAVPDWSNEGDNAWKLNAVTLVGMQSMPGLVIIYGSIVKKKWAVNFGFMALYAFAATLIFWVLFEFMFAEITMILLVGFVRGSMNVKAFWRITLNNRTDGNGEENKP